MERWCAGRARRSTDWRVVVVAALVVVLAGTGVSAGAIGGGHAQVRPQGIDSCTTIDSPGAYVLVGDINASAAGECVSITASDVTLDGAGHTVSGPGGGTGIGVNGSVETVTNVTVENVKTTDWSIGVFYLDAASGHVENVVATDTTQGLTLARSSGNMLAGNTLVDNAIGIAVGGDSTDNTIRGTVATRNKWGIHFERRGDNNTVTHNAAWNNSKWDYYSTINAGDNPVTDLRIGSATVGVESRTIGLKGIDSPPESPTGQRDLGRYVRIIDTRTDAPVSLSMQYETAASDTDEPALWRYAGGSWARVVDSRTHTENRTVVASVPREGLYGLFVPQGANAGNTNRTPTVAPQSLPAANTTLEPADSVRAVAPSPTRTTTASGDSGPTGDPNATREPSTTTALLAGPNNASSSETDVTSSERNVSAGEMTTTIASATGPSTTNTTKATTLTSATATPGTANADGDTTGGSLLGPIAALATALVAVVIAGLLTARRSRARREPRWKH